MASSSDPHLCNPTGPFRATGDLPLLPAVAPATSSITIASSSRRRGRAHILGWLSAQHLPPSLRPQATASLHALDIKKSTHLRPEKAALICPASGSP